MVSYYKLRPTKSKLVNRLNHQSNLIEKIINDGGEIQKPKKINLTKEIQITDASSLFQYKKLKFKL